jgi:uncharacterized protein with LGFP repeats
VTGGIGAKWKEAGGPAYGYPITDEATTSDGRGRYSFFKAVHLPGKPVASIFWSPATGAHTIYGAIREKWASMGWERSALGFPTSDEFQEGAYRRSNFQGGYIIWTSKGGPVALGPDGKPPLRPCDLTAGLGPFAMPCD